MGAMFIGPGLGTLLYHCFHQWRGGLGGAEPCLPPWTQILQSQAAFPKQMKACLVSVVPPSSRRNPTFRSFLIAAKCGAKKKKGKKRKKKRKAE